MYGADVVHVVEHDALKHYDAESLAATAAALITSTGARAAFFSASVEGRDLAPRVAALLGVPLASDVTAFAFEGDAVTVRHPVYAGKAIVSLRLAASPAVISLRPGAIEVGGQDGQGGRAVRVEQAALAADPASSKAKVVRTEEAGGDALDLGEAPVIVSGGRGLKAKENFKLVEDLAAAFGNAAVGATRAVTDDGWRNPADQIGQTGRLVSPDLYVAVGISGAIQHLAGMRTSRTIVAINRDKDAPIFKVADYGIVGDLFEVVPALTEAVRRVRSET
jgi:electron transfer flavoprotein alpha subunit